MSNFDFNIEGKKITNKSKPFLIAEIGQSHGGKINNVYRYIDRLSKVGIDAIKFQTHIADSESTYDEKFRKKVKNFNSRYAYWQSMEFKPYQWLSIKRYCKKKKIIFLSSVFSIKSVKLLSNIGLKTWKIITPVPFKNFHLQDNVYLIFKIIFY